MKEQEKIKVLMIGPDRSVHGGISGVVNNYYDAGLDQKIELSYIGTMMEGSKARKLYQAIKAFLIFCLKVSHCQIVHVNVASDSSYYRKSFFIRTAKMFRKKIVIHQHGGDFENFYYRQLNNSGRQRVDKILSMGDAFLVLAPIWKDFFAPMVGENKITVLPDSIQMPEDREKEYGKHKILFLGRLCKEKGIGELFQIMPDLRAEYPDLHLYLGGVWEDAELHKEAARHSEYLTWLGWISGREKNSYLEQCDIFVLPSYFEGQSVAILEAMAAKCAVVASKTGGIPQMIEDGKTGILINPKDADSLKQGLQKVLEDAELCRKMGEHARKKVETEFSIEKNMEKLLKIYRKVLELS